MSLHSAGGADGGTGVDGAGGTFAGHPAGVGDEGAFASVVEASVIMCLTFFCRCGCRRHRWCYG